MKTVEILETFDGYPSGKKRTFVKGETPDVPAAFADDVVGKGLAREVERKAVEPEATKGAGRKGEQA